MNHNSLNKRLIFVDLLRGWAIIVMIEVHIFNAFLNEQSRNTNWFRTLDFINGLVAPSFLFISGFIFVLLSYKKAPEFRKFGDVFFKQLKRILFIWMIAYLMHVPYYSLKSILTKATYNDFLILFQSDVLHTIAFGLSVLFIGVIFIKSSKIYQIMNFSLGLAFIFIAPLIWEIDFTKIIHPFFAAYLNGQHYSIFPLFPWLGYILIGGAVAPFYYNAKLNNKEREFINKLIIFAIGLIVITLLLKQIKLSDFGMSDALRVNPFYVLLKLGIVLGLLAICWYYEYYRKSGESIVTICSRESLLIYFVHIEIIYGAFFNYKSINHYLAFYLNLYECILGSIILILLMMALAKFWDYMKKEYAHLSRIIFITVWLFIVFNFAIKDFIL